MPRHHVFFLLDTYQQLPLHAFSYTMAFSLRIPKVGQTQGEKIRIEYILKNLDGYPPSASEVLHLGSGSTLLVHISLVIYTAFEIEELEYDFFEYARDMAEKHDAMGQHLEPEGIELCWRILVKQTYREGHLRQMLLGTGDLSCYVTIVRGINILETDWSCQSGEQEEDPRSRRANCGPQRAHRMAHRSLVLGECNLPNALSLLNTDQ